MRKPIQLFTLFSKLLFAVFSLATISHVAAFAQSIEPDFPTPLSANEVSGSIAARDIGDPRLTRYFYILGATPGDLLITVESNNLNGDVDLFTAGTLRPLAKVSMYAAESGTKATKSIFLKQRQQIILRIEARSANDNEGVYRIRFEGSFEPLPDSASASNNAAAPRTPEVAKTRGGTRVSSSGARLPEEVKEARSEPQPAQPEPSPTLIANESATVPEPVTTARRATPTPRRAPRRAAPASTNARSRRPRVRPSIPNNSTPDPASSASNTSPDTPESKRAPEPATPRPAIAAAPPRLVIEFRNGVKTERSMTTVRRVTIDNNQLVIINRDGKIERQQLSDVLRFSIEP